MSTTQHISAQTQKGTDKKSVARLSKGIGKITPKKKPGKQGAQKTSACNVDKKKDNNSGKAKPNKAKCKFS